MSNESDTPPVADNESVDDLAVAFAQSASRGPAAGEDATNGDSDEESENPETDETSPESQTDPEAEATDADETPDETEESTEEEAEAEDEAGEAAPYKEALNELRGEMLEAIEEAKLAGSAKQQVKRIHTLLSDREAARKQVEDLESQVADLSARTPANQSTPGADYTSFNPQMRALNDQRETHQKLLDVLPQLRQRLEDSGDDELRLNAGDREVVVTKADLDAREAEAKEALGDLRLEEKLLRRVLQASFEAESAQFNAKAKELFPWTADPNAREWAEVKPYLELFPELSQRAPGFKLILGGLHALEKRGFKLDGDAAPAKPAAKSVPVRKVKPAAEPTRMATAPAAAPRREESADRIKKLRDRTRETGRVDDLAEEFAAGFATRGTFR